MFAISSFRSVFLIERDGATDIRRILRSCRIFLVVALLFSLNASILQAQSKRSRPDSEVVQRDQLVATLPVVVTAPTALAPVPSTFTVPITVNDVTGEGIISFQFNVIYDPNVIDPSGANFGCSTAGTLAGTAGMTATCNVTPVGTLRVTAGGANPLAGSGTLLNLTFTTDPTAMVGNVSPLTFDTAPPGVLFFSQNAPPGSRPNTPINGQITLIGPTAAGAFISGRVLTALGQAVPSSTIKLTNTAGVVRITRSSPFGYFQFDDVPSGQTYVISVVSKRYVFQDRAITVTGNVSGFDFVADPE